MKRELTALMTVALLSATGLASPQTPDNGVLAVTEAASAAKTVTLSREECVTIALSDNPSLRVAGLEIERSDYSRKETLASLFPQIDFSGAYQRAIDLQTIRMNMGGESQALKMGSDNTWNFGFTASMPLIAPQLWKSINLSDIQILQSMEQARASRLDMVNQVNKAFYTLLLAKESKDVIQRNYENAKFNAEVYEKQFQAGTATEYDVLRSAVQVSNVEPELLQADIAIRQAQLQLKVLLGLPSDVDVDTSDSLENYRRDMYGYMLAPKETPELNTSLRQLEISQKQAQANVDLKKMAWIPTLGASFNYNWNAMNNGNAFKNVEFFPYSTVGLQVSVPIFSGGSKYYALRQAEAQVKELEFQKQDLLSALQMQIDLAMDNINRQVAQIESSRKGMDQAAKAHEIMQKSFEIGAATYLDLRDSELADTSARLSYYQAIYNFLISTSELDLLLGKESDRCLPAEDYNSRYSKIVK